MCDICGGIGNTPLLRLDRLNDGGAVLFGKMENFNPSGSVKDRAAWAMITDAARRGVLKAGGLIVEPTSGNTGIGLAMVAAARGYRVKLTMPETMSEERRTLLASYGAELVLTPGGEGMAGAIRRAEQIVRETPGAFMPDQFNNMANPEGHYATTAPEIWQDAAGKVDIFVAGVGSGGTLSGVGRYLKERNPQCRIVAVEPAASPVLSGGKAGAHKLQGIGAGFVPGCLEVALIDQVEQAEWEQAVATARLMAQKEGVLVGISAGAALAVALRLSHLKEHEGKRIVVIIPDSGDRYLSVGLFAGVGQ